VFDHSQDAVQKFWLETCQTAVHSGVIDGCFSDSSQPGTHRIDSFLDAASASRFEAGKVDTMSTATQFFSGEPGKPYTEAATGVLIGKKSTQSGINAFEFQIQVDSEFFEANEVSIEEVLYEIDSDTAHTLERRERRGRQTVTQHTHRRDERDESG